ncbi:hypothetical protein MCOR07_010014 [Pyricularia oryzae]|nr:hypothetical protein MCOR32_004366 [Pyricularia oryzae]KAI6555019.1 hypothetical protein MCOR09_010141 [Pyricularia oryzae]KAI6611984.1 hypothetical protein MCOR07_010014 [Pyricularia oryzae]
MKKYCVRPCRSSGLRKVPDKNSLYDLPVAALEILAKISVYPIKEKSVLRHEEG